MCAVSTNREERNLFYSAWIDQFLGKKVCGVVIVTGREGNPSIRRGIDLETKEIGNLYYPHLSPTIQAQVISFQVDHDVSSKARLYLVS